MARINLRLPRNIAAGFTCAPEFKTMIARGSNGAESRNRDWLYGRFRAKALYNAFDDDEQAELDEIIQATAGMWASFRFRDETNPSRWQVVDQVVEPVIGTSTPLQLERTYTWGLTTPRMIQAIDASDFSMERNGVAFSFASLDDQLGLVTPSAPWEAGTYTWSGAHDIWMRFNSDWMALQAQTKQLTSTDIELIEVRQYPDPS